MLPERDGDRTNAGHTTTGTVAGRRNVEARDEDRSRKVATSFYARVTIFRDARDATPRGRPWYSIGSSVRFLVLYTYFLLPGVTSDSLTAAVFDLSSSPLAATRVDLRSARTARGLAVVVQAEKTSSAVRASLRILSRRVHDDWPRLESRIVRLIIAE